MKLMSSLLIILLFPALVFAGDFDKTDKALFGTVCFMQIADGLTTMSLQKDNIYISDNWSWKYGTNSPSSERMWLVKGTELVGGYYVAKWLPDKYRKVFLFGVNMLLLSCVNHNLSIGAGFSF